MIAYAINIPAMSPAAKTPRGRVPAFYRPEPYKPEESVALLMRRVLGSLAVQVDKELEPLDLTSAQWVPLYKLYLGHATTAAELARKGELDAGAITRMLDRLEAKNFVRRVRSADDRRVVNLELTDEGRTAAENIPAALSKVLNAHLRGFTTDEWKLLREMLLRMLENGQALQAGQEGS